MPEPTVTLELPWPPSVNHYWGNRIVKPKGKPAFINTFIGAKGKEFRESVGKAIEAKYGKLEPVSDRLKVRIDVHPPDRRARDLSNVPKAVEDALTHAGVWVDDEQIDHLEVIRGPVQAPGKVVVTIERLPAPKGLF